MALASPCQTPGATYRIWIRETMVEVEVELGIDLELSGPEAAALEARLHNAVEQVLAPYYKS